MSRKTYNHATGLTEEHSKFPIRVSQTTHRSTGTVKWFNDAKGFGFLQSEDCTGANAAPLDIFAHYSAIMSDGFKTLKEGQAVSFELVTGPKGPQAFNIEVQS